MNTRIDSTWICAVLTAASIVALSGLAGCQGHGEYTSEHLEKSREKIDGLKSANEYEQARQAFFAGELEKAMESIDKSLSLNPNVAKSYILRARIQIERSDLDGALQTLQTVATLEPTNVEAEYYTGIVRERFGDRQTALNHYSRAAQLDPANPQYPIAAAEMMIDLKQLDQAEQYLLGLNSRFEHNAGVRQTLGHVVQLKGDHQGALNYFNEAHLLAPDDSLILEDLIRTQVALDQFAPAEVSLARLLTAPANAGRRDLRHMRARCLMSLNRPVEARDQYLSLTTDAAGASDEEAWVGLGQCAYTLRDFSRVRLSGQRLSAMAPDRFEGFLYKSLWHKHQGELTQALDAATRAVSLRGQSVDPLVVQGLIYQDLDRNPEALECFQQAYRESPGHANLAQLVNNASAQVRTAAAGDEP